MSDATRISATTLARRLGPVCAASAERDKKQPAYQVLADRIRAAVLDGRLAVATGLPSEREMATALSLSRTTVGAAYALLREQGWLESRRGSGSTLRLPKSAGSGGRASAPAPPATPFGPGGTFGWRVGIGWRGDQSHLDGQPWPAGADHRDVDVIDLTTASLPAPTEPVNAAVAVAAAELTRYLPTDGYQPFGLPVLREAIAQRYTAAGVPTNAEQILVTSGAQHAFTLILGELSAPGDRVLIECPTYPVVLDALRAHRRTPAPVGLAEPPGYHREIDESAWDVELFSATLRQAAPRLGYLIPEFQNPTGALMDAGTRESLVAAARSARTLLLTDESFRDVPFPDTGPLPPPLAAFDEGGTRVLSLGSVSKAFWGGLRVGWIRAAPALVQRLAAARALGDMAGPVLDQLVVTQLLSDPDDALALQRTRLATGAAALQSALAAQLPDWQATRPRGGASLWVKLPGPFATDLALLAPSAGVRIAPGPRFGPDGTMESYLRLPFTTTPERLITAVSRLASIADRAAQGARSSLPGWLA
ncbi:MAG: PLP-dependent aminotransferase family protein [Nakamurella sp.]